MAVRTPPFSGLPWAWVIEALASLKEVDVTILIDVFKRSPEISSDVGSNAREIASLRTLERLFDQDTQPIKSVSSAPNSRVSFNFSERCEDVLQCILGEMHGPTIWDDSEKSKWDAQPFIAHKRSCLLKCGLQQLKDALVEGRLSHLTFLKQRVTSVHQDQSGTRIHGVNGAICNNEQQSPCIDGEVCQDTSNKQNGKGECFDDVKLQDERSKRTRTLNGGAGDYTERHSESESVSDDGWYHKEMNDIATKKQAFFGSNCQDQEVATDWKGANRCMKCKNGGQLLVCSSDACSFVFHRSCLVSSLSIDSDSLGKFYCPFCRYSQAISDYWLVKRKTSMARNDLVSFNSPALKHRLKGSPERLCVSEQNAPREHKVTDEKNEASNKRESDNVIQVINTRVRDNTEDVERAFPLTRCAAVVNDNVPCGEKQKLTMAHIHESRAASQIPKGLPNQAVSELHNESSESSGTEGHDVGSSEQVDHMDRSIIFRNQIKPCNYLHVPQRRRVPVPWTQSEEETLKKWVEKLSGARSIHDRGVPWRKILERGASVFQKSRKPGDLKDKWRNMQKASSNST